MEIRCTHAAKAVDPKCHHKVTFHVTGFWGGMASGWRYQTILAWVNCMLLLHSLMCQR